VKYENKQQRKSIKPILFIDSSYDYHWGKESSPKSKKDKTVEDHGRNLGCVQFDSKGGNNFLTRCQLIVAFTALALAKYPDSCASKSIEKLFSDNIEPYASLSLCEEFRKNEFYGVHGIYEAFSPCMFNLKVIFDIYTSER
jgi:hypothetical protein